MIASLRTACYDSVVTMLTKLNPITRGLQAAAVLLCLTSCSTPPEAVRNNDLLRELFYPPAVTRGGLGPDTQGATFDHGVFAELLRNVVKTNGVVDYTLVKMREPELNRYLVSVGSVKVDDLSRHEQLAFLINAYNACSLKMIAEIPRIRSPTDVPASRGWTQPTWVINRQGVSLEDLEHRWIRQRFGDARVHFALVHAAAGSPPLRREPYTGARLEQQLADQARRMLADPRHLAWDNARTTLRLSSIFDRYRSDFADNERDLVRALTPWMPEPVIEALKSNNAFAMEYIPFDWNLNGTW